MIALSGGDGILFVRHGASMQLGTTVPHRFGAADSLTAVHRQRSIGLC